MVGLLAGGFLVQNLVDVVDCRSLTRVHDSRILHA